MEDRSPRATAMDTQDRVYAALRPVALGAGLSYLATAGAAPYRAAALGALALFALYSLVAYVAWKPCVARGGKRAFYIGLGALDLLFVAGLMAVTGGAHSPFFRALYLWAAMLAFLVGRRDGLVVSVAAMLLFLSFHLADGWTTDPWVLMVQAGGILLHGPLIGFLADRERQRAQDLRAAHEELMASQRRLMEEQAKLMHAEKLSSIGLLAAGVAHEINNPLAGVMGCVRALAEETVPAERRAEYFATVNDGLARMRATVQGLLDFARPRPPQPANVDAREAVEAAVRLVAPLLREKKLRLEIRVDEGEARLFADRAQLVQAVVNVLMNAAQATPEGGAVTVAAKRMGGLVGIRIRDEGPGIPRAHLPRVCDPFFTTKPEGEGTGLGLAVTLSIARAHGGDLHIESEERRGTQVTLWFPAASPPRAQQSERRDATHA